MSAVNPRDRAEKLLAHYLRTVWLKAGLRWNEDNDAEVATIVDQLVDVTHDAIAAHVDEAPHRYADGSTA